MSPSIHPSTHEHICCFIPSKCFLFLLALDCCQNKVYANLPTYLPPYLPAFLPPYIPANSPPPADNLPSHLPASLPPYLLPYLPSDHPTYLTTYLPPYPPTYRLIYPPTYLPTNLLTSLTPYLPAYLSTYTLITSCPCRSAVWDTSRVVSLPTQKPRKLPFLVFSGHSHFPRQSLGGGVRRKVGRSVRWCVGGQHWPTWYVTSFQLGIPPRIVGGSGITVAHGPPWPHAARRPRRPEEHRAGAGRSPGRDCGGTLVGSATPFISVRAARGRQWGCGTHRTPRPPSATRTVLFIRPPETPLPATPSQSQLALRDRGGG